ncbi:hypothetical protein DVH24_000039 [Malus domestica]|uniref:Uncharacterized protein n=1 Tax=Malus domestica TaxID=3750 RepID=A0A498IYV9_MALDO|nr:hypothetical protein DVH24_000039 [Malus domestica]
MFSPNLSNQDMSYLNVLHAFIANYNFH